MILSAASVGARWALPSKSGENFLKLLEHLINWRSLSQSLSINLSEVVQNTRGTLFVAIYVTPVIVSHVLMVPEWIYVHVVTLPVKLLGADKVLSFSICNRYFEKSSEFLRSSWRMLPRFPTIEKSCPRGTWAPSPRERREGTGAI